MKLRLLLSALLGAALPLAFAPFEHWWLILLLVVFWVGCWWDLKGKRAFWVGFVFGAAGFTTGTYWLYHSIVTIGNAPLALAIFLVMGMVAIMALYFGLTAWVSVTLAQHRRDVALLVFPGAFVLFEWLRGWVLSGFPWLTLGYSLPESSFAGWLPVGGAYLGSFVLVTLASALRAIALGGHAARFGAIAMGVICVASFWLQDLNYVQAEPEEPTVALAQLGLDQELKWDRDQFERTLKWYADFVVAEAGTEILLTPEVAIPTVADRVPGYLGQLDQIAQTAGSTLWLGILSREPDEPPANVILQLGPGETREYAKRHLVPFGEFFPVPAFIREWMRLQGLPFSDLRRGEVAQSPLTFGALPVASSICYEDAYASEQLSFFPEARFIVNVTNDAWFGETIAPHQHLQIARTRSAEAQRWQVRAANTGITAIIDDRGSVVDRIPAFEPAVLRGSVATASGHTPFTQYGNIIALLLALVSLGLGANGIHRRR